MSPADTANALYALLRGTCSAANFALLEHFGLARLDPARGPVPTDRGYSILAAVL